MSTTKENASATGMPATALALRDEIASGHLTHLRRAHAGDAVIDVCRGHDSLWVLVRREGQGGFAHRAAWSPGAPLHVESSQVSEGRFQFRVKTSAGEFQVTLDVPDRQQPLLRCTTRLTPAQDLLMPLAPRDLYPLDEHGNPAATQGLVHASQRGLNAAIVYLSLSRPDFGGVLYFQNLTDLNGYFQATDTTPDGVVGGRWPELGYAMPVSEEKPLRRGEDIVISDVFLHWCDECACDPRQASRLFLDLLAGIYRHLERPAPECHDWPALAEQTARDLARSPDATVRHYGNLYLRPYVAAEEPDSMVQLTVLMPMREYAVWSGSAMPINGELRKGMKHFFDPELGTIRRYLPSVGSDKDADAVDSWYLYHPMANLGRLALEGDEEAREMFLQSVEFGIKAARHFHYLWPVQYKINTFDVITGPRKPGDPGQSDVGGLFAYIMTQAWELTGKDRYLEEAKKAIHALRDMEFDLEYQANITTWGACGCLRLWQITGDQFYLDQSYVFLASYFHNCLFWESDIANARFYPVFLGATCLHDGPYMACYECFETYAAFHEYLSRGGNALPDSVRLLLAEDFKYTPSRAWYYYPAHLPRESLATDIRNGHIDAKLAFPLEDLYGDGQPAGQVGQEIYGCGAGFAFVTRSFHRLKSAPFMLFCDYPLCYIEQFDEPCLAFAVRGGDGFPCRIRLIPTQKQSLPAVTARVGENEITGRTTPEGHCEFDIVAGCTVEIRWNPEA